MKEIYALKLGESIEIKSTVLNTTYPVIYIVTRVPGGWLFKRDILIAYPIFIPFDNEFQNT